jgi:hypothetical protein
MVDADEAAVVRETTKPKGWTGTLTAISVKATSS